MNTRTRVIRVVTIVLGVLIIASLVLSLVGCSDGKGSVQDVSQDAGPDRAEVLAVVAYEVILPAQEELADHTVELARATSELCTAPTGAHLDTARTAWDAAQGSWRRTEAFRFGPAESLHSIARIAYPIDAEKLGELFTTPGELPDPVTTEAVADLGADVRGLAAIEQLLFTPGDAAGLDATRCAYLSAAALDVQTGAEELLAAWVEGVDDDPAFADQLAGPGDDSMYASDQDALNDLVNGSIAALTTIADMELGPASGATTGTAAPAEVDAGPAHRALADVTDMLASVAAVYGDSTGDAAERARTGLSALVAAQSPTTDLRVLAILTDADDAVAAIPAPLFSLDTADVAAVASMQDAYDRVSEARVAMRTEVASLLGVTVGFSDSDGDG